MGLFSRFSFNQKGDTFHSSGIAGGDEGGMGAASAQSFEQRQQIEKNRQHIGAYQDANVLHAYRQSAQSELSASHQSDNDAALTDEEKHKKHHKRSQIIPRTSRIENRQTSRIVNPSTSRIDTNARPGAPVPQRPSVVRFTEPQSRRYNPYK